MNDRFVEVLMDIVEDFMEDVLIPQGIVNEPDDGDAILTGKLYDTLKEKLEDVCDIWEVKTI